MKTIINLFGTFPNAISADKVLNTAYVLSVLTAILGYSIFYIWIGRSRSEKISKYNKLRHWLFIALLIILINILGSIGLWNSSSLGWGLEMYIFGFLYGGLAFLIFWGLSLLPFKKNISIHTKSVPKLF